MYRRLYWNLKTALYPVMKVNKTGLESLIFGKPAHLSADLTVHLSADLKDKENGVNTEQEFDIDEDF